ncbi:MAG: ABC transporter substrate-binding protein [Candidatus Bipolaricaulota bacterium]
MLLFLALLIATLGLLAVGTAAQDQVELTFWHHEAPSHRVQAFQEVIERFNDSHPEITVKQEVVSWGDAWEKTLSAVRSGTTPDFQFDLPELNLTAYEVDTIIPVDDLVEELDQKYNYFEKNLGMYRHHGHYWGVPIWTMDMILLYRPSLLKEYEGTTRPPSTWEETLEYAEKLTVDGAT